MTRWLRIGAATLVVASFLLGGTARAQEITLTSRQGDLVLTGRLVSFDGRFVRIESDYGPLTVDYDDVACAGDGCPDAADYVPTLRVSGTPRIAQVLFPALLDGFARARGWSTLQQETDLTHQTFRLMDEAEVAQLIVSIRASSSSEGFADLVSFEADAALSYREASADERARVQEVGLGDLRGLGQTAILGIDALVPIVSPLNPVRTIDPALLDAAFTGARTAWEDGTPITLHLGPSGDGQAQAFITALSDEVAGVTRHADPDALAAAVAADPGALGLTALGDTGVAQPLSLRDSCGLTAAPLLTGIKTQDYPLTTPVFVTLSQTRQAPVVREFLRFLREPEAHLIIRRAGLVDLGVVPIPLDAQGGRLAHAIGIAGTDTPLRELQRMVRLMRAHARASLTFRFEIGQSTLDPVSSANLLTLAHDIRAGNYAGRDILLIGFSDGAGPADANLDLSRDRAARIRERLMELLGAVPEDVRLRTAAFGEALPMGCDDTAWGRQMNRRVEVWIGD
ncbi:phosphate ABC transporter substrate-binding/OmpA family protein [Salipiger sp. IMCC34102]|uniref:phosphate ABC transporter substrate-binding/OmpA family protein n=1 Tax=Salipiger sp. IMCC34102 TaxID=2510647 RepID=UPI0013ECC0D7|nr:phosphate ABC transporter substrate-binding/OmpA family protein [Salipiger sp. IMCC34102]